MFREVLIFRVGLWILCKVLWLAFYFRVGLRGVGCVVFIFSLGIKLDGSLENSGGKVVDAKFILFKYRWVFNVFC